MHCLTLGSKSHEMYLLRHVAYAAANFKIATLLVNEEMQLRENIFLFDLRHEMSANTLLCGTCSYKV